jgi:hypothetical protein
VSFGSTVRSVWQTRSRCSAIFTNRGASFFRILGIGAALSCCRASAIKRWLRALRAASRRILETGSFDELDQAAPFAELNDVFEGARAVHSRPSSGST